MSRARYDISWDWLGNKIDGYFSSSFPWISALLRSNNWGRELDPCIELLPVCAISFSHTLSESQSLNDNFNVFSAHETHGTVTNRWPIPLDHVMKSTPPNHYILNLPTRYLNQATCGRYTGSTNVIFTPTMIKS